MREYLFGNGSFKSRKNFLMQVKKKRKKKKEKGKGWDLTG
jgi:hypothetical protein